MNTSVTSSLQLDRPAKIPEGEFLWHRKKARTEKKSNWAYLLLVLELRKYRPCNTSFPAASPSGEVTFCILYYSQLQLQENQCLIIIQPFAFHLADFHWVTTTNRWLFFKWLSGQCKVWQCANNFRQKNFGDQLKHKP